MAHERQLEPYAQRKTPWPDRRNERLRAPDGPSLFKSAVSRRWISP